MCRSRVSGTPHGGRCLQRSMDAQTLWLHAARNQERHLHHREPIPWRRDSQLWVDSLCDRFVDVDSIAEGLVSYVHLLTVSFGVKLVYILGVVRPDRCRQLSAAVFCPVRSGSTVQSQNLFFRPNSFQGVPRKNILKKKHKKFRAPIKLTFHWRWQLYISLQWF